LDSIKQIERVLPLGFWVSINFRFHVLEFLFAQLKHKIIKKIFNVAPNAKLSSRGFLRSAEVTGSLFLL
jgi:hypothetical protein